MRGKHTALTILSLEHRNIPAYAGKTLAAKLRGQNHAEHPRVCGENALHDYEELKHIGTSPRMRGKRT